MVSLFTSSQSPSSLQREHIHRKNLSGKAFLLLLMHHLDPSVVEQAPEVPERAGHAAVLAIYLESSVSFPYDVIFDDNDATFPKSTAAAVDQFDEIDVRKVSHHPLNPEQITTVLRREKVLRKERV